MIKPGSNPYNAPTMDRRPSTTSESSIEPMDISTKTTSTEANSSTGGTVATRCPTSDQNDSEHSLDVDDPYRPQFIENYRPAPTTDKPHNKWIDIKRSTNNNNNNNSIQYDTSDEYGRVKTTQNGRMTAITNDGKYVCPICKSESLTQHEFTEHIRSHNNVSADDDGQNFTCQICFKVLSSASSLDRHVLVHTGERPFTCKYCLVTFTTNGNMHRHMRTHKHNKLTGRASTTGGTTNEDDYEDDSGGGNRTHYDSDGSTSDSTSTSSTNYGKRKSTATDDGRSGHFKRRLKTINNNNIINSNDPVSGGGTPTGLQRFCCPVCDRTDFSSMISLENHMDREHPSIQARCRYCEIIFKSHKALNGHKCTGGISKSPNITQGFKDLTFVDFSSEKFPLIAKSMCEQTIRTPITNQKFECHKCYRAFPCQSAVDIHVIACGQRQAFDYSIGRHHGATDESDEEARRDDFFAHLDLQNRSQISSTLNTTGDSIVDPKMIMERQASPNDSNGRDLADIQSIINVASAGSFLRQFDKSRSVPDPYPREEEEAQDAFTAEFRKMKLRGEFPCKLCTAVFPNLRALKGHNRIHLSAAGPGPYRCNMCPYTINDKAALIRHMRTHNGDRPYECSLCNYAFTTKANCERHLRNRHGKTTRDEVKRSIIYHPSEDSSCDDPIKKIQIYNASFEDDLPEQVSPPKDRSTPVSHLKELLTPERAAVKIQVKSMEKLVEEKRTYDHDVDERTEHRPIDLSMDALDLSKKTGTYPEQQVTESVDDEEGDADDTDGEVGVTNQKIDLSMFDHHPQFQPSTTAHYLQLYRNFLFPPTAFPLHPFLLHGNFLPTDDQHKDLTNERPIFPLMHPLLLPPSHPPVGPPPPIPIGPPPGHPTATIKQEAVDRSMGTPEKRMTSPQMAINHSTQPSRSGVPINSGSGPVKMVIKNGVLMPKQKQRRYRTERPFACEHCSARFTLRSNMERHIKQQHPQYYAQRQRNGAQAMMRRSAGPPPPPSQPPAAPPIGTSVVGHPTVIPSNFNSISDQVKYAIFAQQFQQQRMMDGPLNPMIGPPNVLNPNLHPPGSIPVQQQQPARPVQDVKPIDEPIADDEDEPDLVIDEDSEPEDLSTGTPSTDKMLAAKKVADTILEQAIKASRTVGPINGDGKDFDTRISTNFIPRDVTTFGKRDESDLVPVARLVDNATNHSLSFGSYFRTDVHAEQSDEEGLVASGSASESNNSGTEENPQKLQKKKSAYSLAPNRVSCPYCQRMFPWSSSLRRHILTHTGQKPFKCSHCPLLFTTKSNCDRHLLRKHGDSESAVSLYVPTDDVTEPIAEPIPVDELQSKIEQQRTVEGNRMAPTPPSTVHLLSTIAQKFQTAPLTSKPEPPTTLTAPNSGDLPFKCHLCDASFAERIACLEHIRKQHIQEFALLMSKGAIETDIDPQIATTEDDDRPSDGTVRGKYPDYTNRKVVCAFCMRRFWSTEDLRRHMRTHSGERPFQCDICLRKFTLKHSMLRHQKKHEQNAMTTREHSLTRMSTSAANSGSDMSDDDHPTPQRPSSVDGAGGAMERFARLQELLPRELAWKIRENLLKAAIEGRREQDDPQADLIGNLLGISDQGMLNKVLLSSADEAAKLLGVDK